jgi:hypothetical protein
MVIGRTPADHQAAASRACHLPSCTGIYCMYLSAGASTRAATE